jgi:hypothetical protein
MGTHRGIHPALRSRTRRRPRPRIRARGVMEYWSLGVLPAPLRSQFAISYLLFAIPARQFAQRTARIPSYRGVPGPKLCGLRPRLAEQVQLLPGFGPQSADKPPD